MGGKRLFTHILSALTAINMRGYVCVTICKRCFKNLRRTIRNTKRETKATNSQSYKQKAKQQKGGGATAERGVCDVTALSLQQHLMNM